ncbi:MAG: UDP-3-O-(3-hydroxymyristoyl)glucosamine N-acyltransferase [Aquisalimonadaceae bacterium]
MGRTTLEALASALGLTYRGDGGTVIDHLASLTDADQGALSFLADSRYRKHLAETRAAAVVLHPDMAGECPVPTLLADNPHLAFARAATLICPPRKEAPGIHPSAAVDPDAHLGANVAVGPHVAIAAGCHIGEGASIGPGCVLGQNVIIGADTRLVARVTVWDDCVVGSRCIVHAGTVIGSDGFGYANDHGRWEKVPQVGRVLIGNDVEVGSNASIDRGAIGDTVIGDGVKLDNLVHIAHNVVIGDHTIIAACTGVAGSTRIGKYCAFGGIVGVAGHITIADGVQVTGMTQVTKSLTEAGVYSSGTGVEPNRQWRRNAARFHQLDDMARRLRRLEQRMADPDLDQD